MAGGLDAQSKGLIQQAREFLLHELAGGPRYVKDLKAEADGLALKWENVRRASRHLGMQTGREKIDNEWVATWLLPSQDGPVVPHGDEPAGRRADASEFGLPVQEKIEVRTRAAAAAAPLTNLTRTLNTLRQQGQPAEIWRYVDGNPCYVTTIPAAQFNLQWLKARLGGGRFNVSGNEFTIEGEPREYQDDVPPRVAVAAHPVSSAPVAVAVTPDLLTQMLMQQMKANQDMLMQMLAVRAQPGLDPMDTALKIVGMLHQQPPAPQPVDQAMALLKEGMKLGAETAGGEDDGMGRIAKLAEPLLAWLTQAALTNKPKALPAGTVSGRDAPSETGEGDVPLSELAGTLVPYVPDLVMHARQATDVNTVAEYILSHSNGETLAALDGYADRADFDREVLKVLSPHLPPETVPWFQNLVQAVRRELVGSRPDANGAGSR